MMRRILTLAAGLSLFAKSALAATVVILATPGDGTWTVPQDFGNVNSIEAIGGGSDGNAPGGTLGSGGGAGAYVKKNNVSLVPGASISYHIGDHVAFGAGQDSTWFNNTSLVLAQGAASNLGGQSASSHGDTKFSGGSVSAGGFGGGGAAGPHGDGQDGVFCSGGFGVGGTGDNGNTAAGANGTQFDASHGSGGGGTTSCLGGTGGTAGGAYGAGGGGGDPVGGGSQGAGRQGLIVITYTPLNRRVASGVF